jgi:hypothetical protein
MELAMKIEFDVNDNNMLLDIMGGIFITLLQRELKESQEALLKFKHPDDVKMYKRNIKSCKQLLDYYGGEYE